MMLRPTRVSAAILFAASFQFSCAQEEATPTLRDLARARGIEVGVAVRTDLLAGEPRYARVVGTEFSSLTPENALKWASTEPSHQNYTWDDADAVAAFATAHGQTIRGHTLIWANSDSDALFGILPDYVAQAPDAATLQGFLDDHVEAVVSRYAGVTTRWDVVNEPLATYENVVDDNVLTATLGEAWMVRAFQLAHDLDPEARLYVNEALIDGPGPRHDALIALVTRLRAAGAPIHGVGLQSHFLFGAPPSEGLEAVMNDWGALGIDVAITELDIPTLDGDLQAQAFDYARVFESCLATPACVEVTIWGVSDAHSWLNTFLAPTARPLLYDSEYLQKPAYDAVADSLRTR